MRASRLSAWLTGIILLVCAVHAGPKDGFGLGIIVGEPTGLSLKKWTRDDRAVDAGVAWSFSENDSLHLHADYLFHRFELIAIPEINGKLPLYFGLGARVKLKEENNGKGRNNDDVLVGVRVPLGISYLFENAPFDIFAEVVPVLDLAPDTDFDLNAAVGTRLYF